MHINSKLHILATVCLVLLLSTHAFSQEEQEKNRSARTSISSVVAEKTSRPDDSCYARVFTAKVPNGMKMSIEALKKIARDKGTEEIILFPVTGYPEQHTRRWMVRKGSDTHSYPGFTVQMRGRYSGLRLTPGVKRAADGLGMIETIKMRKPGLKALIEWKEEHGTVPPNRGLLRNTVTIDNEVFAENIAYDQLSFSGKQHWPQAIRVNLPAKNGSLIQVFEYLKEVPPDITEKPIERPGDIPAGLPHNADGKDSSGGIERLSSSDTDSVSFSASIGPSYDWDTGWVPCGYSVQVRLDAGAGSNVSSTIDGDFQLDRASASSGNLRPASGSGSLTIDVGAEFSLLGRVDVWVVDPFEFPIPFIPNFDLKANDSENFSSYLLDTSATASDYTDRARLVSLGTEEIINALTAASGLGTVIAMLGEAGIAIDAAISVSGTMRCESISSNKGLNFYNEGQYRSVALSNGAYSDCLYYNENLTLSESVSFWPTFFIELLLWNWDFPVFELPWTLISGRQHLSFSSSSVDFPEYEEPTITVSSPNGGESWQPGTSHSITWTSSNVSGYVKIELYRGTTKDSTITSGTSDDGSYSWSIPSTQSERTDYRIKVTSTSDTSVYDYSNSYFTITQEPTISGYVRTSGGSGISVVTMTFSNGGGSTTTDSSGYYSKSVSYGWSGTVTPSKSGYSFTPSYKSYSNVTSSQTNQNYIGEGEETGSLRVTISPQEAIDAGAQWRVQDNDDNWHGWFNSGYTKDNLPVGSYTVDYKDIDGWTTPSGDAGTIQAGDTSYESGTYVDQSNTTPFARWSFEEGSGDIAVDSIGGHDGILSGPSWESSGFSGGCLRFSPSDTMTVPHFSSFSDLNTISISFALKLDQVESGGKAYLLKKYEQLGDWLLVEFFHEDFGNTAVRRSIGFDLRKDGVARSTSGVLHRLNAGIWYEVVCQYDGTNMEIYIDGTLAGSYSAGPGAMPIVNEADIVVGGFDGLLDELQISTWDAPNPPSKATNPSPSSGATGQSIYTDISWSNGGGATNYDVYFGTDSTPDSEEYKGNQTSTTYDPCTLNSNTTYYWRIDAKNSTGTTTGDVWYFTTATNGPITLAEAVDNTSLTWTTGGNANWFGQAAIYYYGGDAAQTGAITHNQSSWVETTVTGPGTLTFYCKVSSESGYDYLRFYIDGVEQSGSISGNIDWQQKTYSIASGSYTLKWAYTKDVSVSSGSDAGWLDKVVFDENIKLYFPHIASGGDWETEIAIINNNVNQTVSGELKAYNDAGQEVSNSMPLTLDPHVRREITIGDEFTNPSDIGYIIFDGYFDNIKGYTKFYIEGTYRVAVPAVKEINTGDIYISHIPSDSNWWTGISLLNTSSSSISFTIEFDNGESKTITLAANEHRAFTIAELFNGQPQPDIQSAVIKNASGVIGLELFGSAESSGNNYLSGILLKDDTTSTIYYPHIASDTTWWTGIVAYNPSNSACDISITPYSAEGSPLTEQSLSITGHGKYIGTAAGLSLPDGTAWLQIQATSAISGFELFGTQDGNQLAGYTGVGISGKEGVFAKLEKDGWTGIAFVNIDNSPASVTLTAYDDSGTIVATETMNVSSYAKVVNIAEDIFTQDISTATYINYSSDKEVVGFQLNGSSGGMMLDGLPGM